MKYLQITNLALLALGAALTVVLSVVCLIYVVHLDADPVVRRQLPFVVQLTVWLAAFAAASLAAWLGHRRQRAWRWPAQALPVLLAVVVLAMLSGLRN